MANVRCPMCSKLNPPDAEVCSYCGARLKPLRTSPGTPPAGGAAGNKPGDSDAPDWLSSLRSDEPEGQGSAPAGQGESDQEPDWLSRIRSHTSNELGDAGKGTDSPGEPSDDTPEWMRGMGGAASGSSQESGTGWLRSLTGDQPDEPPTSGGSGSGSVPLFQEEEPTQPAGDDDWLNKLADWGTPASPEPPAFETPRYGQGPASQPAAPEPGPAEEDFSWLNSFGQDADVLSPEQPAESAADSGEDGLGLTSFLSSIEEPPTNQPVSEEPRWTPPQEKGQPPAESSGFGLTGFLSGLGGEPQDAQPEDTMPAWGAPEEQEDALPQWLGGESLPSEPDAGLEAPAADASSDTSFADWLQSLESGASAGQSPEPTQPEQQASGPLWLTDQPFDETPTAFEAPASQSPDSDLPSWLEGAEPLPPQAAKPSGEDSALPSWLAGFGESTAPQPMEEPQAQEPDADQSLPSWISMESGEVEEPSTPAESVAPIAGLPDWFSSFEQAPAEPQAAEPESSMAGEPAEAPMQEQDAAAAGDVPEWLRDFDHQAGSPVSMPPLIESESPLVPSPAMEGDQPFAVDLPDWLAEDSASHAGEGSDQPLEPAGEQLAQADLPEWVKDMRPIESIIPGEVQMQEVDRHTERSGPLAGMNGILPAEELAGQYRKPPVYSVKLRVTEKQRGQASQLDTILSQETQPLMIPPQAKRVQGLLVRIVVALLIIAVLAVPPLLGLNPLAMPMLSPRENEEMYNEIEQSLQQNAPVLLAVDFEPAFYGEMKLASLPVIDHLMAKNSRIVVVSTRANGPALAEQLLNEAAREREGFNLSEQTINLGYLPGDMISLLEFARQPAFAAPATLTGEQAWSQPILQGIVNIQDFAQVVVITDTAETGRAWVEQVQPLMGDTPLMMVTSAQAGPMMAPFVESNQIDGMVSGLLGGVMYAQRTQQETPANSYLASYQIGTLLAFGLTLVGAAVSGGMALFKREDKDED